MRLRAAVAGTALCLSALPAAVGPVSIACAAEADSAALVVDTGDSVYRYCVTMPDDSVTGIELIQLAGEQHGLQYSLGYGGQAVCQLQGVGPDGDDCFAEDPYFWGYWHGDGSGGWNWSSTGAGSYRVEPGDVEGWSWGTGQSGDAHPKPPATTYASVCPVSAGGEKGGGKKDRPDGPDRPEAGPTEGAAASGSTVPSPSASPEEKRGKKVERRKANDKERSLRLRLTPSPDVSLLPQPKRAVAIRDEGSGGPPTGGILAIAGTAALAAVGAVIARRRRR